MFNKQEVDARIDAIRRWRKQLNEIESAEQSEHDMRRAAQLRRDIIRVSQQMEDTGDKELIKYMEENLKKA